MILNTTQIGQLKRFNQYLSQGKSKVEAAELTGVSRSTLANWGKADNASAASVAAKPKAKAKPAAPKLKVSRSTKPKATKKRKSNAKESSKLKDHNPAAVSEAKVETVDPKLADRVIVVIGEQLGFDRSEIKPENKLIEDLGGDSLDAVELVVALEDEFEINIPDEIAARVKTVSDVISEVNKIVNGDSLDTEPNEDEDDEDTSEMVEFQAISLPKTLMVVRDGLPVQVDKTHKNFDKIKTLLGEKLVDGKISKKSLDDLYNLIDMKSGINAWGQGRIKISELGKITVDGKPMVGKLADVMVRMFQDGDKDSLTKFANFHEKVNQAISFKVTTRLFEFITKTGLKIDQDGDIIALKVVRHDYKDKHSGTFDNSVGKLVEMNRNEVDDRDEVTCSKGLHVCAPGYIKHFASSSGGDRLVECKVDPRDFVSVPVDYNFDKARVCKYVVLRDVSQAYKAELYNK